MTEQRRHCDDFIDDWSAPWCLRAFLRHARAPAHGMSRGEKAALFASLRGDQTGQEFTGQHDHTGGGIMKPIDLMAGQRVRVVMASRMGDVGVTHKLEAATGYVLRVGVEELACFSAQAVDPFADAPVPIADVFRRLPPPDTRWPVVERAAFLEAAAAAFDAVYGKVGALVISTEGSG
jgi:hypothetical protein